MSLRWEVRDGEERCQFRTGNFMAERGGFEPPIRFNPYNGLANRRLQPLGHLSTLLILLDFNLVYVVDSIKSLQHISNSSENRRKTHENHTQRVSKSKAIRQERQLHALGRTPLEGRRQLRGKGVWRCRRSKSALDTATLEGISFLKCMGCGSSCLPTFEGDKFCRGKALLPG